MPKVDTYKKASEYVGVFVSVYVILVRMFVSSNVILCECVCVYGWVCVYVFVCVSFFSFFCVCIYFLCIIYMWALF